MSGRYKSKRLSEENQKIHYYYLWKSHQETEPTSDRYNACPRTPLLRKNGPKVKARRGKALVRCASHPRLFGITISIGFCGIARFKITSTISSTVYSLGEENRSAAASICFCGSSRGVRTASGEMVVTNIL